MENERSEKTKKQSEQFKKMKTFKDFRVDENSTILISDKEIKIMHGRSYMYLVFSFFAVMMGTLIIFINYNTSLQFLWFALFPISIIMNAFVYKMIIIDLLKFRITRTYALFNKRIIKLKSINFSSNEFYIKKVEGKVEGEETVNYYLEVNGNDILKFNSFESACNIQKYINWNTGLLILVK